MKTPNNDLFDLVKTLTKSEKTYFKRSAYDSGERKIYIKLFDEIEKQKKYDEKKLKEKFSHINQFSVLKTQLYEAILNALEKLANSLNYSYRITVIIRQSDQLYNRGLYGQAEKLLMKAKGAAYQSEDFTALLQVIAIEKKLILKQLKRNEKKIKELHKEENNILLLMKNLSEYNEIFTKTYLYFLMYGYIRNRTEEQRFIKNTFASSYEELYKNAKSKKAEQFIIETFHLYHTSKFDTLNAMKYNRASLKLMEENNALLRSNVERYLATYQNYVLQYYYKGDIEDLEKSAGKLKTFLETTKIHIPRLVRVTAQGKIYDILLSAYHTTCKFEKAIDVLTDAEKLVEENYTVIDKSVKNVTYQMGTFIYFTTEDYENALRLSNKLINDPDSGKFLEVYCFILLLQLLIHYELGNYDLIEYITKSTKRYLSKTEKLFKIEKLMLSFFGKIIKSDNKDKDELFENLQSNLRELRKDPDEGRFEYYDFSSWCESKIRKIRIQDVLTEKYISGQKQQ